MFTGPEAMQVALVELIELLNYLRDYEGIDNGTPAYARLSRRDEIVKRRKKQKQAALEA
jgi:hypothetical protein